MKTSNSKKDYQNYLNFAQTGHYPLFFNDWLTESLSESYSINFRKADQNVKNVFNQLARHRTLEKKKTALIGMDLESRKQFIQSFLKVVEHKALKGIKTIQ